MALDQSEDRFNGVVASLAIKAPCRAVTSANILLEGEQTIDTIAVVAGDRVLVIAQTDPVDNGIYNVRTSSWERSADFDGNRDVAKGTIVNVNVPTNSITSYVQLSDGISLVNPIIGSDPITFTIFFSLNNSLDDLSDVDLTGCSDDDLMHFVGGILVCTLGQLQYDGVTLQNAGPISVSGFSNEGPQLRAVQSADLIATVNPRRNDQFSGIGGTFGNLDFLHDNNATSSFLGLRLRKQADLFSTREWNVEGISASTTQTQGEKPVKSSLVRVTVVANDDDVITLREPQLGMDQVIMNRGANVLQIFPASGDDLSFGTDTSMTLQPGGTVWFGGIDADTWHIMSIADGSGGVPGVLRGCKAYSTVNITVPNDAAPTFPVNNNEISLALNAEAFDTDNIHDNSTNNSRLTVPAGVTRIILRAGAHINPNTAGLHHMRMRKAGGFLTLQTGMFLLPHHTKGASGSGSVKGFESFSSGLIDCVGGDFYELYGLGQNNVTTYLANTIWFEMEIKT